MKINCIKCGTIFAVSNRFHGLLNESGRTFYCPNGHQLCYPKKKTPTNELKLIQENEQLQAKLAELQNAGGA